MFRVRFSCFSGRGQAVYLQCPAELLHLFADLWRVLHGSFSSVDQAPYTVRVGESKWGHQFAKGRYRQSSRQPSRHVAARILAMSTSETCHFNSVVLRSPADNTLQRNTCESPRGRNFVLIFRRFYQPLDAILDGRQLKGKLEQTLPLRRGVKVADSSRQFGRTGPAPQQSRNCAQTAEAASAL